MSERLHSAAGGRRRAARISLRGVWALAAAQLRRSLEQAESRHKLNQKQAVHDAVALEFARPTAGHATPEPAIPSPIGDCTAASRPPPNGGRRSTRTTTAAKGWSWCH